MAKRTTEPEDLKPEETTDPVEEIVSEVPAEETTEAEVPPDSDPPPVEPVTPAPPDSEPTTEPFEGQEEAAKLRDFRWARERAITLRDCAKLPAHLIVEWFTKGPLDYTAEEIASFHAEM
ncbi:MAG TPA: hypothetical protein V6D19_06680, partial [Stenomitos sp.]